MNGATRFLVTISEEEKGEARNVCNRLPNLVTNPVYDVHSKQPEYKFSAVQVTLA